jgi:hypothetical protein
MLVIASNGVINQAWQLALTSLGISFCYSVTNVAMNSQGVDLEVQLKKSLMPRFHAGWSTGSFTTAVLGAVVAAVLTPTVHLSAIGITATLLVWLGTSMMSPTDHKDDSHVAQHEKIPADVRKRIVFISFAMSLGLIAEVSVFDWSSIYMHETLGLALGVNALGVTCFYAIQIVMRAFIGSVQDRYGIAKVVRRVGLFAGITYLGILLVTNLVNSAENAANSTLLTILAGASFGAVAIGVAAMPAAFLTAAGRIPQLSTARGIAAVAMTNAFFILLFKTIVSTIAGSAGLPIALMCTACGLLAASFLSGILESDLPVATTLPS